MTGSRRAAGRFGLVVLAALFTVAVALINLGLRGLRIDLTENRLYTLSEGTYAILEQIPEPVNLYLFYSDRATADIPYLRTYANRVREMLQEFAQHADGMLNVTVVDPAPFSEDEDRANEFGLPGIALGQSPDPVYFGIAATNAVGDEEIIDFLDPAKEGFLEYDLAKLIATLSQPERPVIGLLSGLPMTGGFDPATQQMGRPWLIAEQVEQLFEVRALARDLASIDEDVDVLMVVQPRDLDPAALYAIDQFIVGGGHALLFVDPYSEADSGAAPAPGIPAAGQSSDLNPLLAAWGLTVDTGEVVGDDRFALPVTGFGSRPVRFLPLIGIDATGLDGEDVITAELRSVNLGFPGYISIDAQAPATVTPLIRTSDLAGTLPAGSVAFVQDPERLRDSFEPRGESLVLAARIGGEVPSAFPDGPPADVPATAGGHRARADGPINVILVADTDLLTDRMWSQSQNFFGQRLSTAFAGNADFVVNALDNLTGSSELISIRGRAAYSRPFTRVEALRVEAEARFRETEKRLEAQLDETEARLAELQASREDSSALILTDAQRAELERFRDQRLRIRKELRQVRRELDQSIESLGTRLKIVNIALVPALIALLSLGLAFLRRRAGAA